MVQKEEISVTDKWPFAMKPSRHVHANMDFLLGEYAELLTGDKVARDNAWRTVEACFDHNGFTDDVKAAVSKKVYNSLEIFVSKATGLANENAMVLVRANPKMPFLDEDAFGYLGKRGKQKLEASSFSRQVWTGFFNCPEKERCIKIKRAVHAILVMASKA